MSAQFAPQVDGTSTVQADVNGLSQAGAVSHIHCATLSPDGKYLFVTDLGLDALYRFDAGGCGKQCSEGNCGIPSGQQHGQGGCGKACEQAHRQCSEGGCGKACEQADRQCCEGGCEKAFSGGKLAYQFDRAHHPGPRHLIFSADGRFAYLLCELSDELSVFAYEDGNLRLISTQMAYSGGGHGSADLHLSPDGRFLYTSHRLEGDGISAFAVDASNGTVAPVGFCPTGKHPRNFAITPDGRYLLCACRDAGAIEIYSLDAESGLPVPTGRSIEVPAPVCIRFLYP